MANLESAIDCAFWDQSISTPKTLEGSAKSVPGEPFPLDGARASKALRIQQLSLFKNGFPLGIIPSMSPPSHKDLGSFSLQSLLLRPSTSNWWLGLIGQFRPKKLISAIKTEFQSADELELPVFRDSAKHFLDKSLYSIALATQLSLSPSTSLLWSTERQEEKKGYRNKFRIYHQLPDHDITLDAAWPELFMDHKGKYWEVPESISLDLSSLPSDSGFLYRFGLHKNSGPPQAFNELDGEAPPALMPGLCAKVALSYQKSKDLWRKKETKEDLIIKTDKGSFWRPSYDVRLKEPHAAISGIVGMFSVLQGIIFAYLASLFPNFPCGDHVNFFSQYGKTSSKYYHFVVTSSIISWYILDLFYQTRVVKEIGKINLACLWEGLTVLRNKLFTPVVPKSFFCLRLLLCFVRRFPFQIIVFLLLDHILGVMCAAWFGKDPTNVESQREDTILISNNKRSPLNVDLFGSACYTLQRGQFRKLYGDLTRVDARLDICSLSSFVKRVFKGSSADKSLLSPRLNLIFQQQVAGPIVFRVDSKLLLDSKAGKRGPHIEDVIYSLCYSLRLLRSGKVVAWYSPKRKEGMIELRLFEF